MDDGLDAWLFAEDEPVDGTACELDVTELRLDDVGMAGPFARELPIEVKAWMLGMTEVRLALEAAEEVEAVTLPVEDTAAGLSVEDEETSLVTPVAEPEAGLIPSVPGLMVGNNEELSGTVLLRDVCDSEGEGSVGIKPET